MTNSRYSRREVLRSLAAGSVLMPGLVSELLAQDPRGVPHFPARARRVIFLTMSGGVSHVDTFDPKPRLFADHGKKIRWKGPRGMETLKDKAEHALMAPAWKFKRHGKSGTEVSEIFPQTAECVDELCVLRSMRTDNQNHIEATIGIHTGSFTVPRPSLGSWLSYGLGTENRNLPSFVVISPALPLGGTLVWSSDFLPAVHQGVRVTPGDDPVPNLTPRPPLAEVQETQLALLDSVNRRHLSERGGDGALAARVRAFETAFRMQREAPEVFDLSRESDATLALYGLKRGQTTGFGWQCLVARRMAERGVRFVELIDSVSDWDAHSDIQRHKASAANVDRPIAGLLRDLKSRGMLDETLVVWTTEFGRSPFLDGAEAVYKGRAHHAAAFSSWMAGGGVRGGMVYGKTDEYGLDVVEDPVHVHDFHATILHLMGLDHTRLTYRHGGRDFRLTDVHGRVVKEILG